MKTILVDAAHTFVSPEGAIFEKMRDLLDEFSNPKIIVTNANAAEWEKYGLDKVPYKTFTLEHNPNKTDTIYFQKLLTHLGLTPKDIIYFEHTPDAVKSAESLGITSYLYDSEKKDLVALKKFLVENLN